LLNLRCERMVVGVHASVDLLDAVVCGPRAALRDRSRVGGPGLQDRLVVRAKPLELMTGIALIADFNHQIIRELALDIEQPLVHVRRAAPYDVAQNLKRTQAITAPSGAREPLALFPPGIAQVRV